MQADYQNFRNRLEVDYRQRKDYAAEEVLCELLEIADNLERAVSAAKESGKKKALLEGLDLIVRQIKKTLERQGAEEICAQGECFDPYLHEAAEMVESDRHPDQTMTQVSLRFCITHPACHTAIPGAKTSQQVADNCAASDLGPLPQEAITALE